MHQKKVTTKDQFRSWERVCEKWEKDFNKCVLGQVWEIELSRVKTIRESISSSILHQSCVMVYSVVSIEFSPLCTIE